ncbi:MAG: metallophosphoesterase [Clostridia bacterium]|nr:metallophosphoesterase [Clostridia bacterium]
MKIAAFSDIHGNLKALRAVLEQIKAQNVDLTVFLGDIFQRGNEEVECLELLKASGIVCLKGNCELYMEQGVDIDPDVEYLRSYYDETRKKLNGDQMRFIRQMPLFCEKECCEYKIHFSHFLFSDVDAAYPFHPLSSLQNGVFDRACESESVTQYDLVVIGHSHQNFVKGNVVSVSASGLEGASYLIIEAGAGSLTFEHIPVEV